MKKPKKGPRLVMPIALVSADFAAGFYTDHGSPVAVTDLFGEDAEMGCTFYATDIMPGSGLRGLANGGASLPAYIGALRDAIIGTNGSTVVFDFDYSGLTEDMVVGIDLFNSPDWDLDLNVCLGKQAENILAIYTASVSSGPTNESRSFGTFAPGRSKFSVTFTKQRVAVSLNGAPVQEIVPNVEPDWSVLNKAYIGNTFCADYLRSMTVHSPQDDAVLVALSTP